MNKFLSLAGIVLLLPLALLGVDLSPTGEKPRFIIKADAGDNSMLDFDMGLLQPAMPNPFSIVFDSTLYPDEVVEEFTPSCLCTLVNFSPQLLEPGRSLTLSGSITADAGEVFLKNKTIKIKTNYRQIQVTISGKIALTEPSSLGRKLVSLKQGGGREAIGIGVPREWKISSVKAGDTLLSASLSLSHRLFGEEAGRILVEFEHDELIRKIEEEANLFPYGASIQIAAYYTKLDSAQTSVAYLNLEIQYEGELTVVPRVLDLTDTSQTRRNLSIVLTGPRCGDAIKVVGLPDFLRAEISPPQPEKRIITVREVDVAPSTSGKKPLRFQSYEPVIVFPSGKRSKFTVHTIQ